MEDVVIPKHTVIQYVRDKNGNPRGVLVAVKNGNYDFRLGYSFCNKKDRFNKCMALKIALGRAYGKYMPMDMGPNGWFGDHTPHSVKKMVPDFIQRCKRYYKV